MSDICNRCFYILLGLSFHYFYQFDSQTVIPFLLAIIISFLLIAYPKSKYIQYLSYGFVLLSFYSSAYLFYFPLLVYQEYQYRKIKISYLLLILTYAICFHQIPFLTNILLCAFSLTAILLKYRFMVTEELQVAFVHQRDASKELANLLEDRNHDLILQQEYEIKIATLDERNRIAREIHDNVGHLLSSSLLQVGALQTMQQSIETKDALQSLRDTISSAMDNVRNSVHDLYDDAIDFEVVLHKLLDSYSFCTTSLEYMILHPLSKKIIYHFLAIIKECLHNTMKHSNANLINVILREQNDFYQLIIHDNGSSITLNDNGIGIKNIHDRIEALHGYVNINIKEGFQVFITLPKEENK